MKQKDNKKRYASQIKIFAASKQIRWTMTAVQIPKLLQKNKAKTGVLPDRKNKGYKTPNYKGYQNNCVMYNKAGITERNYK